MLDMDPFQNMHGLNHQQRKQTEVPMQYQLPALKWRHIQGECGLAMCELVLYICYQLLRFRRDDG